MSMLVMFLNVLHFANALNVKIFDGICKIYILKVQCPSIFIMLER